MAAMTMPYTVKDLTLLDKLTPGDKITADVVVQGDDSWIENVVVTGHSAPPKPTTQLHIPATGDAVPNFILVNQDNKPISLQELPRPHPADYFYLHPLPIPGFLSPPEPPVRRNQSPVAVRPRALRQNPPPQHQL